jgi:hypothetical protein
MKSWRPAMPLRMVALDRFEIPVGGDTSPRPHIYVYE